MSVPIAVVAAVGAASKAGVLIKGGAAVAALGSVRAVAIDKTGTITRNEPVVIDVVMAAGVDRTRVLIAAAALEARGEHPPAAALPTAADLLAELQRTATRRARDPFGRLLPADPTDFARAWLSAALYTEAAETSLCAAAWQPER
ncbi:hypothetical protein DRB96_22565 [Streptomyces sp. ICC1]|nr:hypothetical protein DRB96_22565 [Streptomyces sp. ICC1]